MGLVAPRHVGPSRTRARTRVPCIGRRILNHCATREVLGVSLILSNVLGTRDTKKNIIILAFKNLKLKEGNKQGHRRLLSPLESGQLMHNADYVYDSGTSCLHLELSIIPTEFHQLLKYCTSLAKQNLSVSLICLNWTVVIGCFNRGKCQV